MHKLDQLLFNNKFYKLSGNYVIFNELGNSISKDIYDLIDLNKIFNAENVFKNTVTNYEKLIERINLQDSTSLFLNLVSMEFLEFISSSVFEFIYCDLTNYDEMLHQYEIWCELRKLTNFLCVKINVYNETKFLIYDNTELEVSVIFPVYNVSQYLEQCFRNFLTFKHDFIELIAVNDGSTDNSLDILKNFSTKDYRIKILNKTNGGCASARMHGLEHAKGKYVAFVDPDDFVEPDFLLKLHMNAVFSQCQVIQCGYKKYYMETDSYSDVSENPRLQNYYTPIYAYLEPLYELYRINDIAIWRRLYKRDFLLQNKITFPISIRRFDDLPFFFEVFSRCVSFVAIPDKLYNYRLNRPGQDIAINDEKLYIHFDIFAYLDKFNSELEDVNILRNLLISRINSHMWSMSLLQPKYYSAYIDKLILDFKIHIKDIAFSIMCIRSHYGGVLKIEMLFFLGVVLRNKFLVKKAMKIYMELHNGKI